MMSFVVSALFSFSLYSDSSSETREQAIRLFSRVAGVNIALDDSRLDEMVRLLSEKKYMEAADIPTRDMGFPNATLFNFFAPMSNRSEGNNVKFNDFIIMGIENTVHDFSYKEMVTGNFTSVIDDPTLPPVNLANNSLYDTAFDNGIILTPSNLKRITPQRNSFSDAAGALTSRQFMIEHGIMGTNRRLVEFAFRQFLNVDIKQWRDSDKNIGDAYVTRDVSRAPGGDPDAYQNECRACHQVMDSFRGAFAYHDVNNNQPTYAYGSVAGKINQNVEFNGGYRVVDDSWTNKALYNHNTDFFGWRGNLSGMGANAFGEMIGNSFRFSTSAVERVWKLVCAYQLSADDKKHQALKNDLAKFFESTNYNLRELFKKIAVTYACADIGE